MIQNNTDDIKKKIDANLNSISSSPKESSVPIQYIQAHQTEYDEIIQLGQLSLNHILEKFNTTYEDGLNSWIMAKICSDILGNKTPVKGIWMSGRDWYKKYLEVTKNFFG